MPPSTFVIRVEGNIASGKSSFLRNFENLVQDKQFCTVYEPLSEWEKSGILEQLYTNPKQYTSLFNTNALFTQIKQYNKYMNCNKVVLIERSLQSTRKVFIENLKNKKEFLLDYNILKSNYETLEQNIDATNFACNLWIYLKTSPEIAYKRCIMRNRKEEKDIDLNYLKELHLLYENWFNNFTPLAPVIILNANNDMSTNYEFVRNIIKDICSKNNI